MAVVGPGSRMGASAVLVGLSPIGPEPAGIAAGDDYETRAGPAKLPVWHQNRPVPAARPLAGHARLDPPQPRRLPVPEVGRPGSAAGIRGMGCAT